MWCNRVIGWPKTLSAIPGANQSIESAHWRVELATRDYAQGYFGLHSGVSRGSGVQSVLFVTGITRQVVVGCPWFISHVMNRAERKEVNGTHSSRGSPIYVQIADDIPRADPARGLRAGDQLTSPEYTLRDLPHQPGHHRQGASRSSSTRGLVNGGHPGMFVKSDWWPTDVDSTWS